MGSIAQTVMGKGEYMYEQVLVHAEERGKKVDLGFGITAYVFDDSTALVFNGYDFWVYDEQEERREQPSGISGMLNNQIGGANEPSKAEN